METSRGGLLGRWTTTVGDLTYRYTSDIPTILRGREVPIVLHLSPKGSTVELSDLEALEGDHGVCFELPSEHGALVRFPLSPSVDSANPGYRCTIQPTVSGKEKIVFMIKRAGVISLLPVTLTVEEL